jgi:ribonuclease E
MKMLINATQRDELRSVTISNTHKLLNYDVDTPQQEQKKSNIYKAVITSIERSLGALFVNFGSERTGFLPFSNISPEYYNQDSKNDRNPDLHKLFKLGQELVVQVEKDERGSKGAALTTYISLAGSFCVLMPNNSRGGGISRQIEGKERENLQEKIAQLDTPEGMGVIVRTAGVNRSVEELNWDLKILLRYWDAIKQAAVAKPGPYLIHQESNVVLRSVRDNLREEITEVIIDDKEAFQEVHDYVRLVRPDFLDRIKLHESPTPLFSQYQIENQIEMAYEHEVELPSGGSIVIDHTEALVSIDVNSARATKGGNIEETALQTNLEAAEEIARQLRIRDLAGLIVIDFIDMTPMQNRREVENCLRDALKMDRARIQTERISRFGLLEMSRQRLRRALSKTVKEICPRCKGQGMVLSVESLASTIIHRIEQQLAKAGGSLSFTVHAPTTLATYLMNERRACIAALESNGSTKIAVIPNQHIETPDYTLQVGDITSESALNAPSYEKIKQAKQSQFSKINKQATKTFDEPIMNQYLTMPDAPINVAGSGTGLFKRLITRMFGEEKATESGTLPAPKKAAKPTKKPKQTPYNLSTSDDKPNQRGGHSDKKNTNKNELPIPSTTRKIDEKSENRRAPRSTEQNKTRRGSRGGSRNTLEKTLEPELGKPEIQAPLPKPKEEKPVTITPNIPIIQESIPIAEVVTETAAPNKKERRKLSSAKQPMGATSRSTGSKKPTRPSTNPTKRIRRDNENT